MSEQLNDREILSTTFIGGRQHGKRKMMEDMIALNEKIKEKQAMFKDLADALDFANAEATTFGYKFDQETGVLTIEEYQDWDGLGEEPKTIDRIFRLVEVKE